MIHTRKGQTYNLAFSFRDSGKDLLIFIHGLGCSRKAFDLAWEQSHLEYFSLLSVDLLGFGESPKPLDFPYTMEAHGYVVGEIIRQFPGHRVHFVGNSMGPIIGLAMPHDVLNSLASFANLEARLIAEDCGNSAKAAALTFEEFSGKFWPVLKEKISHEELTAYDLNHALPEAFYRGAQSVMQLASSGWSYKNFLELRIPKMYFYGDDEKSRDMKVLDQMKDEVPMKQISKSGHFMMLDNSSEFYSALSDFIENLISADEFEGWKETMDIMSDPEEAAEILERLRNKDKEETVTFEEFKKDLGLS